MILRCYKVVLLLLQLGAGDGYILRVDGDLSFTLFGISSQEEGKMRDGLGALKERGVLKERGLLKEREVQEAREAREKRQLYVTAPPVLECPYQYPEKKELEAILSNMINELTKIFGRAHQLVSHGNRHASNQKRFRITEEKKYDFFEEVFKNMTTNFRKAYKRATLRMPPPHDACDSQTTLKDMWTEIMGSSLAALRTATTQSIEEYLRMQKRSDDFDTQRRLSAFVTREMTRVRGDQLAMLCDNFQLCYGDLL